MDKKEPVSSLFSTAKQVNQHVGNVTTAGNIAITQTQMTHHHYPAVSIAPVLMPTQELSLLSAHADAPGTKARAINTLSASGLSQVIETTGMAVQTAGLFAPYAAPLAVNRRMVIGSAVASGAESEAIVDNKLTESDSKTLPQSHAGEAAATDRQANPVLSSTSSSIANSAIASGAGSNATITVNNIDNRTTNNIIMSSLSACDNERYLN